MKLVKICSYTLGGLLLVSCADKKGKQVIHNIKHSQDKRVTKNKQTSPELDFLRSRRYKYVSRVAAIPSAALAAIEGYSHLCDTASGRRINLTDVHIHYAGQKNTECTKKLNFALVSNTCCLIVYRQGGIGVHDVICYVHYRGKYYFTTNDIIDSIDDTVQLANFLQKPPFIEKGYFDEIAPPPPWPTTVSK